MFVSNLDHKMRTYVFLNFFGGFIIALQVFTCLCRICLFFICVIPVQPREFNRNMFFLEFVPRVPKPPLSPGIARSKK